MDLLTLLDRINVRPELYIGMRDLYRLHSFINGYVDCCRQNGLSFDGLLEFQEYVSHRFCCADSLSWASILLKYCPVEEDPFDLFLHVLSDYKNGLSSNR